MEDNLKISIVEIGSKNAERINLAQDRVQWPVLMNKVMNLRIPRKAGNFLVKQPHAATA